MIADESPFSLGTGTMKVWALVRDGDPATTTKTKAKGKTKETKKPIKSLDDYFSKARK